MSASDPNQVAPRDEGVAATVAHPASDDSARLVELLDGFMAELKAGMRPDKARLLAENPGLARQLEPCLAGIEFIQRTASPSPEGPAHLGEFRILREIGRGGMGVVYEAEQTTLKRRVALKVLKFGLVADSEAMDRFQREAETVARLHHTHIVPVLPGGRRGARSCPSTRRHPPRGEAVESIAR